MLAAVKIAAGLLTFASLATLVAPIIGESIATLPPAFPVRAVDSLAALGLPYEEVAFPVEDGLTLRGWFIPSQVPNAAAIVYAPATSKDQRSGLSLVPAFHAAGYHVLLFSYRGHALSDGRRLGFTYGDAESRDLDAAVRYLLDSRGIRRIAVIGHSAGAVAAILSAARNPLVGAVIAVAPFNSVAEIWHTNRPAWVPPQILNWTLWASERLRGFSRNSVFPLGVVDQIAPRPLLLIHGTADRRISEEQIRLMFAAANAPKSLWLVQGATHSAIREPVLDQLAPDIVRFLDQAWRKANLQQVSGRFCPSKRE